MPKKTLYVKDEDQDVWKEAEALSEGRSMAAFVAEALRAQVDRMQGALPSATPRGVTAPYGQKMIGVNVRFFTDELLPDGGKIWPKHAWSQGMVAVEANRAHGIRASKPIPFNSIFDLTKVVEQALVRQGVVLHANARTARFLQPAPAKRSKDRAK